MDALDLKGVLNDFVDGSLHRLRIFAKYVLAKVLVVYTRTLQ